MYGKRLPGILLAMVLIVTAGALFKGCSTKLSESQVEYADPIIDNILEGIRETDYEMFSKDFGSTMKSTIKEEDFNSFTSSMSSQYGDYSSRSFTSATKDSADNTIITYDAQYSKSSHLSIILYINNSNGISSVVGLLFDSPESKK